MFWGLTLEPGKRYAQQVETSFHISMAALDVRASTEETVSVVVEVEKNEFILCNLSKKNHMQQAMDLNFMKADHIAFTVKGKGVVHLTGFIIPSEDELEDFEDMEEEEMSDEEVPQLQRVKPGDEKKRKGELPTAKNMPAQKKSKAAELNGADDSDESDEEGSEEIEDEEGDSDDEEGGMVMGGADEDDDDDDEEGEEEEEDGEEEEEDDDDSEEEQTPAKPVQKQQKQKTPQSQQQQQQKTPKKEQITPNKKANGTATPKEHSAKKGDNKQTPKQSPKDAKNAATPGGKKTLHGGVVIEDLVVGKGPAAASGKQAAVYYVGRNKHNNKQFDATQSGPPFKFRLGKSEVIKGWDIGVQGMKVGGKRRVICPPHMAYGNKGSPPVIPPNSTLVFDIELKGVS